MPSTRELRRRIRSVRSTRQITKAMELVSASKMRRASEGALASRPYSHRLLEVVQDILHTDGIRETHPLLAVRPVFKVVAIAISSDQGLAGTYNSAVIRQSLAFAREQQAQGRVVAFITWGRKVEQALVRAGIPVVQSYPHASTHPLPSDTAPLGTYLVEAFRSGQFDQVALISTDFISMLRQEVRQETLLPLGLASPQKGDEALQPVHAFTYEPSPAEVLTTLLPRLIEVRIFQALLESLASEHSARCMAMKNATDNASDIIDDLTLTYNGVRQSAITQEIAEITSGAAALSP